MITTAALRAHIEACGLEQACRRAAEAATEGDEARAHVAAHAVVEELQERPLSAELLAELGPEYTRLFEMDLGAGPSLFAVRSSAAGEDAADHSHAGQFDSVLNLRGLSRIEDAVRRVWCSWYSDRAVDYRIHAQLPTPWCPPMAVLVQRMIPPRASGILFTAHPVTGDRQSMVLEAGPGLGEALAQGRVHPDYFVLLKPRRPGDPLRITERGIADKRWRLEPLPPGSGSLEFRPLPAKEQKKPCLEDHELQEIGAFGLRIEGLLGCAADVEWTIDPSGRLFLLQARPVTALREQRHPSAKELRARPVLWTQRFSGERWTEQATPLGWSVIQPVLHHFIEWDAAAARWLDGTPPTKLIGGRPYFNLSIFRHLVFRLPGGAPPEFVLEMFPPEEQAELRAGAPLLPNLGLVASIFGQVVSEKRWRRYRYNLLTNHDDWEAFRPEFERRVADLPVDFRTAREGLDAVASARGLMLEYMGIHLLSLLFAHLFYEALDTALASWVGVEGEAIRSALVADPAENRTLQTNKALWRLAQTAEAQPAVAAALRGGGVGSVEELGELEGGQAFAAALEAFLAEFGHRSSASYEVFATRWADTPDMVLGLVAACLRGGERAVEDPEVQEARRTEERAQAERLVRQRMRRTLRRKLVPWRQQLFGWLLEHCRKYMGLRENQRFAFDRLLLQTKRIFERIGALLERDGLLAGGDDLVFLELNEVDALVAGRLSPEDAAARVTRRRAEFSRNLDLAHPDFLEGAAPDVVEAGDLDSATRLHGMPISPGRVRGTVRVLRSLDEMAKLQPGDILVARATDPGWTPLFLTAGGVILELGSVLSHGAVVAREYGLPAVVNVEGATRILRDGMDVTLDGDRGRIVVHRAEEIPLPAARKVNKQDGDA